MGFFDIFKKKKKMSDGLEKTRTDFFQNIVNTLTSSVIDDDLYNDLEEQLILADVGPSCAVRLVDELRDEVEINGQHTGQVHHQNHRCTQNAEVYEIFYGTNEAMHIDRLFG